MAAEKAAGTATRGSEWSTIPGVHKYMLQHRRELIPAWGPAARQNIILFVSSCSSLEISVRRIHVFVMFKLYFEREARLFVCGNGIFSLQL